MSRVLDHQPDVFVSREVDGQLHLRDGGRVEHVRRIAADGACAVGRGEDRGRHAGASLPEGRHYGRWVIHATTRLVFPRLRLSEREYCGRTAD